ncbi:MAG TPA: M56 family metallopeptidase [Prosthecobacter sp.]|nr:M56 family metallopeptidase [Prosthecobacter sp.]
MLWFLTASTVILAAALVLRGRRRGLEMAVVLVVFLPVLRWSLERAGLPLAPALPGTAATAEASALTTPLAVIWSVGFFIGLVRLARQLLGLVRLSRSSRALRRDAASRIAAALNLPPAAVRRHFRRSDQSGTPMVLPLSPALVLLPADWDRWPLRLQISALRHEWHHVRNGDAYWHALLHLFCLALWFHPLAWCLAARWADECEAAADRAAVGRENPAEYASDLLSLTFTAPRLAVALGFLGSRQGRLSRRIEGLFRPSPDSRDQVPKTTLLLLIVLAVGCAWTGMRQLAKAELLQEAEVRLSAEAFPEDS